MRKELVATCVAAVAAIGAGGAYGNEELGKMSGDPKGWVMPAGDYANTRYSKLNPVSYTHLTLPTILRV